MGSMILHCFISGLEFGISSIFESQICKSKMHLNFLSLIKIINLVDKNYVDIFLRKSILLPKLFWPTVRKKCSHDREILLKFEAEGREFANFLRSLEQFIQTAKGQNNFETEFLTYSWWLFRSNKLEQLYCNLQKIIGNQKPTGKIRKWKWWRVSLTAKGYLRKIEHVQALTRNSN